MGAIADVYEDLEEDVPFEDFEAAVHEKVEQMGGLADEETAAMLVAHELGDGGGEVDGVADVEAGMDEVKFLAKVLAIGELRTFERDGDQEEGHVVNVDVADETGQVRLAFWDEMATSIDDGQLEVGDVLRVAGRPKEGYSGLEVSVDKAEVDEEAEVDVQVLDTYRVEDLALGQGDVNLVGRVLDTDSVRTFDRDDGSEGRVSNLTLGDETGRVRVTLWDEKADRATELDPGTSVEVVDGYVRERDGALELHVGGRGAIQEVDEEVEFVPDATDIADVEIGQTVDLAGGVIEADEKRTFDRDDGSQGQVRNIRIRDDTGDIRVALWGEKADKAVDLADEVVLTDVEIQDGWQDDLEASAGWRSTVSVLASGAAVDGSGDGDEGGATAGSTANGADRAAEATGLDAFGDAGGDASGDASGDAETVGGDGAGSQSDGATASMDVETGDLGAGADDGGTTPAGGGAAGGGVAAATTTEEGEVVEFTGAVVQTGSPVVLDNGEQTRSVETDEAVRLGEEVTVRGTLVDGRIHAEEVF